MDGTLAYVPLDDRVAVIDFSDPNNPRVVATVGNLGTSLVALGVNDGFIFTLSAGTSAKDGLNVSIARPASLVFVHGKSASPDQLCANPVLLSRPASGSPSTMLQPAEAFFQIFGHGQPTSAQAIVRRGETVLATAPCELVNSPNQLVFGRAEWRTNDAIDRTAAYTMEIVLDNDGAGEFHSAREPIPFSLLINEYQTTIGLPIDQSTSGQSDKPVFAYVLGASAAVTLTIDSQAVITAQQRPFGLNVEQLNVSGLTEGNHSFTLRATTPGATDPITDTVTGVLVVTRNTYNVRPPGHTVISGVDISTGQLSLSYTDLEIPNRGLSLSLTRSYNQATANLFSGLGYGWRHNYQVLVLHDTASGSYTVVGGDGQGQVFLESKKNTQTGEIPSESPFHTTLVVNSDRTIDFFTKARVRFHFPGAIERSSSQYFNSAYIGNLSYIEEPNKNRITLAYDQFGRIQAATDFSERSLRFEYEQVVTPYVGALAPTSTSQTASGCVRKSDIRVLRDKLARSDVGKAWRLTRVTGPGGLKVEYSYDATGNLASATRKGADDISDPAADYAWLYEYTPTATTQTSADLTHILKKVTNPNGNPASYDFSFDQPGLPVKQIAYPLSVANAFAYTFSGAAISKADVTDGRNNSTSYTLSGGFATAIDAPRSAHTDLQFNADGLLTFSRDPEGLETTISYDAKGNPTQVIETGNGISRTTGAEFNQTFSKPVSTTDANGNTSLYSLDTNGNVKLITLPTTRQIRMDYNAANGDLATITDERGLVTSLEYDSFGNPAKVTRQTDQGASVETTNTFDARSRLKSSTDTLAPTTSLTYDAMDRILTTTETDPSGFHDPVATTYGYKPAGQIASMTVGQQSGGQGGDAQSYSVGYHYDQLDRTDSITETASGAGSFTRAFAYDNDSNLTTETDRRGVTTTYIYDELNFVASATVGGSFGQQVRASFTPNKVGLPTAETDIYGQTTTNGYDGLHRLTGRTFTVGSTQFTESVTLDANGNAKAFKDRNNRTTSLDYDGLNRVQQVIDPHGRTTSWLYQDATGTVTMQSAPQGLTRISRSDALGRPLTESIKFGQTQYDSSYAYAGRSVTMTDPRQTRTQMQLSAFGQVGVETMSADGTSVTLATSMRYSTLGGMRSFTDANNRVSSYTLDGLNRVTLATYAGSTPITEAFTYDGEGNLLTHRDGRGITSSMQYDNIGRVKNTQTAGASGTPIPGTTTTHTDLPGVDTVTDPDSVQSNFPFASKQIDTDPLGHVTVKRFDALRRLVSLTNAESRTKTYEYDGTNLTRETDFKRQAVGYRYDDLNRPIEITDRLNQLTTIAYDDTAGLTTTITDRRGNQRVETRDQLGRLTSATLGGQLLGRYEYDSNNNRSAMIDGRDNRTTYSYDAFNRVQQIIHAGNIQTELFEYDSNGNVTLHNDGRGGPMRQEFDELNRMTARIDGAGNRTEYRYDGRGVLTDVTEPKRDSSGNPVSKTHYDYNELGSLTKVTDANQAAWTYRYDDEQKLVGITDAEGRPETTFDYDVMHRMTKVTRPLAPAPAPGQPPTSLMVTQFRYDGNSNRKLMIDPMGRHISTTFDALDRARDVSIANADSSLPSGRRGYTMDYDPEGNLTSVTERVGLNGQAVTRNYSRTYDSRNRMTSATDPLNRRVAYSYDAANNVTTFADAANRQTGYTYDAMNRLDIATLPGGRQVNYDWTADGLLSKVTYGNGMQRVYGYDNADRVTSIVNTLGASDTEEFNYSYDANSNRDTETRKFNGQTTRSISYQYDALNRLTQANYGANAAVNWGYDKVGNRVSEIGTEVGGASINRTFTHDEANRLRTITDSTDASKSLTLDYDLSGNLTKEHKPNGDERRFEYDAFNQMLRTASFAASGGSETELGSYDYDFEGRRIARTTGASTLQYVYSGINVVNEYSGTAGQLVNSYDYGADLVRGDLAGEGERLYFHDALGSTTALSSGSGSTVARYEYDAWGKQITAVQPSSNRVNFTGYRHDDETSFDYAMARYYDSGKGRFTSFDPVTENNDRMRMPQGTNFFGYVMSNPVGHTDPRGLDWIYNTNDKAFFFRQTGESVEGDVAVGPNVTYIISEITSGPYKHLSRKRVLIDPKIEGPYAFKIIGDATDAELERARSGEFVHQPYQPADGSAAPKTRTESELDAISGVSGFGHLVWGDIVQVDEDLFVGTGKWLYNTGAGVINTGNSIANTLNGLFWYNPELPMIKTFEPSTIGEESSMRALDVTSILIPFAEAFTAERVALGTEQALNLGTKEARGTVRAGASSTGSAESRVLNELSRDGEEGVSRSEYARLRRQTPSREMRSAVNPKGAKVDPVYGYSVERLEADHIVSMKEVTRMPGFNELSPPAKLEVLNLRENFAGLGKATNASKGARSWTKWKGHSQLGPVPERIRREMLVAERRARAELLRAIQERIGK